MMKQSERLLTVWEAEEMTGRKVATWRRDILQRKIAYVKIGRSIRIPIEVVRQMIEDGYREPVALNK